jgi:hypothetical protein
VHSAKQVIWLPSLRFADAQLAPTSSATVLTLRAHGPAFWGGPRLSHPTGRNETVTQPKAAGASGFIEVYQDRAWFGDPKLAVFNVYLDKKRVGKVPLQSSVRFSVAPGQHRLRIRQWYYGSRPIAVTVAPGETKKFRADVPNKEGVRGIGRMTLKPTRCLVVQSESSSGAELAASPPLPTQRNSTLESQEQVRQTVVIGGAMALLGFALIVIGLVGPTPLAVVGAVIVVIGVVWNVRTAMQARRVVREQDRLRPRP